MSLDLTQDDIASVGNAASSGHSASLGDFSDLPFRLFACIADRNPGVSIRETEAFMELIQKPDWTRSPALATVLSATDRQYSTLWKDYAAGHLPADTHTVRARTLEWLRAVTEMERAQAQADLTVLARNLFNARAPWWGRRFSARSRGSTLESLLGRLGPSSAPEAPQRDAKAADSFSGQPLMDVALDPSGFWRRGGVQVRCIGVIDETHDVKTFRFAAVEPVLFCYKAGQAATLEVSINGTLVRRAYTISSSPSRPVVIDFTIKRIPGGQVSSWLHANLRCGSTLTLHGPHGRFTYYDHPSREPILLSAGSGITPMLAMTRWLTDTSTPVLIDFLHYASTPGDFIARDELEQLQRRFPNLCVTWVCTRPGENDDWSGERGRLTTKSLQRLIANFRERDIFLCGPAPFMQSTRELLLGAGCDPSRIHQESFGARAQPVDSEAAGRAAGGAIGWATSKAPRASQARQVTQAPRGTHVLRLGSSHPDVPCGAGQTVLEALEAAGHAVPYSCRAGVCGTCKLRKRKGTVVAEASEELSVDEREQGYFLSCCSRPTTDLELEL
jgi:ferredoxin-NADP reductase